MGCWGGWMACNNHQCGRVHPWFRTRTLWQPLEAFLARLFNPHQNPLLSHKKTIQVQKTSEPNTRFKNKTPSPSSQSVAARLHKEHENQLQELGTFFFFFFWKATTELDRCCVFFFYSVFLFCWFSGLCFFRGFAGVLDVSGCWARVQYLDFFVGLLGSFWDICICVVGKETFWVV